MAKKPSAPRNKSQAIREALAANPDKSPKEIAELLSAQGYKLNAQYVSTIKSNANKKAGGGRKVLRRKPGQLMALAIKFDQMIRDGVVKDQAELAGLGFVTRARVTQIMNLLNLAAPIQLDLLELSPVAAGEHSDWSRQRATWSQIDGVKLNEAPDKT